MPTLIGGVLSEAEGTASAFEPSVRWRVVNLEPIIYGWALGELRFFGDAECSDSGELVGSASAVPDVAVSDSDMSDVALSVLEIEASGSYTGSQPSNALDGLTWTEWRAQCYACEAEEAWLSVTFSQAVDVRCVSLWQWGEGDYRTARVALERWEAPSNAGREGFWQRVLRGSGLGSGRWDAIRFVYCGPLQAPENGRVVITNDGYYPSEATFSCTGAQVFSGFPKITCSPEGDWYSLGESGRRCWTLTEMIICMVAFFVFELLVFGGYYFFRVLPKDKTAPPLTTESFIPEENQRGWTNDFLLDLQEETRPHLLWCIFCPCCRLADTWRGAGLVPYATSAVLTQLCCVFIPCMGAWLRASIRERLEISSRRSTDFAQWICCCCCAAAQEAKHVDDICEIALREGSALQRDLEKKAQLEAKARERVEGGEAADKPEEPKAAAVPKAKGKAAAQGPRPGAPPLCPTLAAPGRHRMVGAARGPRTISIIEHGTNF